MTITGLRRAARRAADMNFRELAVFAPLIAWAIWIGVYPKPYFEILQTPVNQIVERVKPGYFGNPVWLAEVKRRMAARTRASHSGRPSGASSRSSSSVRAASA